MHAFGLRKDLVGVVDSRTVDYHPVTDEVATEETRSIHPFPRVRHITMMQARTSTAHLERVPTVLARQRPGDLPDAYTTTQDTTTQPGRNNLADVNVTRL